jgi:hypothetical protein
MNDPEMIGGAEEIEIATGAFDCGSNPRRGGQSRMEEDQGPPRKHHGLPGGPSVGLANSPHRSDMRYLSVSGAKRHRISGCAR